MGKGAAEFLDAMSDDREIREYLGKDEIPEGIEMEAYLVEAAAKFGYSFTREELKEAVLGKQEAMKAAVNGAVEDLQKISVDELDEVAGGGLFRRSTLTKKKQSKDCQYTYLVDEDCWALDSCDKALIDYQVFSSRNSLFLP